MSPDLRHATVFVKPLLGKDEDAVLKALRTNTAYLQREVATRVQMKYAAKLKFLADESFDEGSHIDALLRRPEVARDWTAIDTTQVRRILPAMNAITVMSARVRSSSRRMCATGCVWRRRDKLT